MHTQTITAPAVNAFDIPHGMAAEPADQFSAIVHCSRVVASEFSYNKDEEIYGEGEPSEYLYQIISGAVRTYKLLSDGRGQISAFHLPGWLWQAYGPTATFAAGAIFSS
jgi:CRP/FNR family nitrogen fixation transcriptional regulator